MSEYNHRNYLLPHHLLLRGQINDRISLSEADWPNARRGLQIATDYSPIGEAITLIHKIIARPTVLEDAKTS